MPEEIEKKWVKELRFALGVEDKIIFLEYFSDNTTNPDSPIFTKFIENCVTYVLLILQFSICITAIKLAITNAVIHSSCRDYITKHYKGSKLKAVYTGIPDYQKNELEGIING